MPAWKLAKLELAQSMTFPNGSPSRAYLLRLPLLTNGLVDEARMASEPKLATVRRFWPNEPDESGHFVRLAHHWAVAERLCETGPPETFCLDGVPIAEGGTVVLLDRHGEALIFRIVSVVQG